MNSNKSHVNSKSDEHRMLSGSSKKRLKIIPYSNLCINCQSKAEEEEKRQLSEDYIDHLNTLSLINDDETFKDSDE